MEVPKDRRKLNAWCRYFYDSEPLVHAALTLHTEFPLSGIYIEHPDPEIKEFLDDMLERLDLFEFLINLSLEYWTVGECCHPDTLIMMGGGTVKPIQDIVINDKVITHTGNIKRVYDIMSREVDEEIYEIKVQGTDEPLCVTGNHPILYGWKGNTSPTKWSWRKAKKLKLYDKVLLWIDSKFQWSVVENIEKVLYTGTVYNFDVEDDHSYVANRVAVHNCFPTGMFDNPDDPQMWEKFVLLDPDFVDIYSVPFAHGDATTKINLLPSPLISRIVENGPYDPNTGEIYQNLPSDVIQYVRAGQPMPMDPLCTSHIKSLSNPHNERGTPLLLNSLKLLMYRDKLRSAQYAIADRHVTPKEFYMIGETGDPASNDEIQAFKETLQATWTQPNQAIVYHHALRVEWHGACHDVETECMTRDGFKTYDQLTTDTEIATFNWATNKIEYQKPSEIHIYDYDGDLYHFNSPNKVDIMVTPNHKMLVSKRERHNHKRIMGDYKTIRADEIVAKESALRVDADWDGINLSNNINIGDHIIALDDYLALGGYYVSEGTSCIGNNGRGYIQISQNENTETIKHMRDLFNRLPFTFDEYPMKPNAKGNVCIRFQNGTTALIEKLHEDFSQHSHHVQIAQWIKDLPKDQLCILLNTMCEGDGSNHRGSGYWTYVTTSKQLADDVQEIVWKCGYAPTKQSSIPTTGFKNRVQIYKVYWTTRNNIGKRPRIAKIDKVVYTGKVWCVTVPNGFFVTRRNGKLTIQGNSGHVLPLQAEFDDIEKHILAGLMTSRSFLHGEGPSYASSSIALDVLIQRYLFYRKKLERWLLKSVFGPILKIHGMYKPEQSQLNNRYRIKNMARPLWYPEIVWEKQNLRDDLQRSQLLQALYDKGLVPASMVLKYHNIDPEVAMRGIEKEKNTIFDKNAQNMPGMPGMDMPGMDMGGMGGGLPPLPEGSMPMPSEGGLEIPPGGFGGENMAEMPIGPGIGGGATAPESIQPPNLPMG